MQITYVVAPEQYADWRVAMESMRRSRLRSGASRWELYRVGERADTYLEIFTVPSWAEHLHQHQIRLTAEDQAIEQRAFSFVSEQATTAHLLPAPPSDG